MNNEPFGQLLSRLRRRARLTNIQLARRAEVSHSLIPGIQSGKRKIGELQARKLALALGLSGIELEKFVYCAINNCTEKVLKEAQAYPAELLNLLARQLRHAGITPEQVWRCQVNEDTSESQVAITLWNGKKVQLKTKLALAA